MPKDNILRQCKCISKHEKDMLIRAIDTTIVDSDKVISRSEPNIIKIGMPVILLREELRKLIGDYVKLRDKIEETPIC